jgi:TolB protein
MVANGVLTVAGRPTPSPPLPPPSASGTLILVRRNDLGGKDLYSMSLTNRTPQRLTNSGSQSSWAPAPSLDGQEVAYSTGAPGSADIAVMRRDGSGQRVIVPSGALAVGSPWWMPDGRIAFNGTADNRWEIYAVPLSGGTPVQVTRTPGISGTRVPAWPRVPNGPLAFAGEQGDATRIFIQQPDGSPKQISPEGIQTYAPAWSPNGQRLAFQTGEGSIGGIGTVAADGSGFSHIAGTRGQGAAWAPAWSPDGQWIAYVSNRAASVAVEYGDAYVIPSAGGQPIRLTTDGLTYDWRIAWLP